jgi:hypothetical protein
MKQGQFSDTCPSRTGIFDGRSKSGVRELRLKCVMPIEAERMIVAESVIGERVTFINKDRTFLHAATARGQRNLLLAQHT